MSKQIIIKPVITEKAEKLSTARNTYTFFVDKAANKIEIKKSIERIYSVTVESVNTSIKPGKLKSRNTKTGVITGQTSSKKKAYVTLASGDQINIFGDNE
ncbi:MAG TPA: 50S ribosomal protein L23 [Saprospiraceae bacterium]|nr:50S ribosomal protein L23 [Saprospiraceae bacterium]